MLLRHRLVDPDASTWTTRQRAWLGRRRFDDPISDLAFADAGGRRRADRAQAALAVRISWLAVEGPIGRDLLPPPRRGVGQTASPDFGLDGTYERHAAPWGLVTA
jgi:hypothetical protein